MLVVQTVTITISLIVKPLRQPVFNSVIALVVVYATTRPVSANALTVTTVKLAPNKPS